MGLHLRLRHYLYHLVHVFAASSTLSHLVELSLILVVDLLKLTYIVLQPTIICDRFLLIF